MPFRDRYGYELTTTSAAAADAYGAGIDAVLAFNEGAEAALEEAAGADDGFALARMALARQLQLLGRTPETIAHRDRALADASGASLRERQHIAALAAAIGGDAVAAMALMREHLAEFPRDAYILMQMAGPFGLVAFNGAEDWRTETFALMEPMAAAYGEDWWFLTTHAFAHNELRHFETARRMAERSLELQPRTGNGAHTMSHVFFETGDHGGGGTFLAGWLPGFPRQATIFSHLNWHNALFQLKQGKPDAVRQIYAETLAPGVCPATPVIGIADAASLLWRCDLYGVERPANSRGELRDFAASAFPKPGITFADLHCALAYAAADDIEGLSRLAAELRKRETSGKQPAGPVVVAIVDAIAAFARQEYERAVEVLLPLHESIVRIGGSNAQREVFEDTLLEACVRAGRFEQAEPLLRARLDRRPSERDSMLMAQVAG